jgi:hypothetical protein
MAIRIPAASRDMPNQSIVLTAPKILEDGSQHNLAAYKQRSAEIRSESLAGASLQIPLSNHCHFPQSNVLYEHNTRATNIAASARKKQASASDTIILNPSNLIESKASMTTIIQILIQILVLEWKSTLFILMGAHERGRP